MSNIQHENTDFDLFKKQYEDMLKKFLKDREVSEIYLNEGYEFGRLAISKNVGILTIVAIHHDCLVDFLEKLETDNHLDIANRASVFLEEVLSSYQMVENDFSDAINLLNKKNIESAVRIRALQDSLKEKEVLLKEIYHRVKNNLQVISSLLNLQVETTSDSSAQLVLLESAARVKTMALIHEMLYQSGNLARVEMADYVKNLFNYLYDIYEIDPQQVKHSLDIDSISLNIDKAIPCGLIINELVSNAFKHAFPNNKAGEIKLTLNKQENNLILAVEDNGVGVPENIDIRNTSSLGMQLIHNLTKQLAGNIVLKREIGAVFTLTFLN